MHLPYYKQEQDYSCGAATARMMVNGLLNTQTPEAVFCQVLKTNDQVGTMREWFEYLNDWNHTLVCTHGKNATLADLQHLMDEGHAVAVLYILHAPGDPPVGHWAVVKQLTEKTITLMDPWMGPSHTLDLEFFMQNWYSDPALCNGVKDPAPWVAIRKK